MMHSDYLPKVFIARFQKLAVWNVAAQFAASWRWPDEIIKPLGWVLARRSEAALDTLTPESLVTLLTIRFDGSIEPREPTHIKEIKGKLYRVYPGDVIFSKIDVRNGAIGLSPDDINCMCATSEFPIYYVNTEIALSEYVRLLFRTVAFKNILNSMISGTSGRKRIQPSQVESAKVPIPSLHVQHKIVAYWAAAQQKWALAEQELTDLVAELRSYLVQYTHSFREVKSSRVFLTNYAKTQQWDIKAGRAAAFISANPGFVRLGDYTEECSETVRPWEEPEKDWFFHNPTRANVGSLGIVPEVPEDAITSPEYQVWRLKGGYLPEFMALMIHTDYFLALIAFNRVGGVKQRMYYANLAEIRLPMVSSEVQQRYAIKQTEILNRISQANETLSVRKQEIEKMILGINPVENI